MNGHKVPAIAASAEILRTLAERAPQGATLSELAKSSGRAKSTTFNLLQALVAERLVVRDALHRFHLGPGLIPLGAAATRRIRPLTLALERVPALCADIGLAIALVQPTSDVEALVLDGVAPPTGLYVGIRVGDRYGPLDGAIGKLLLASQSVERAQELIGPGPLAARTERTITDPEALLAEVASVRRRGWATSAGELNENNAVAAGTLDADGRPSLMLVALGFRGQLSEDAMPTIGIRLRELADDLTLLIGGTPLTQSSTGPRG